MTAAAQEFVTPLTFQAVSGRAVRTNLWDSAAEAAMGHIELARWAELVLIAPATAGFLARLASGQADDLLTTLCLATEAPLAVAPAMNRVMWAHAATRANVSLLTSRGVTVIGPAEGDQACGEFGAGRMQNRSRSSAARWRCCARAGRCWGGVFLSLQVQLASASIRCASSAIAAPAKWALPWRRPHTRRAPRWCW